MKPAILSAFAATAGLCLAGAGAAALHGYTSLAVACAAAALSIICLCLAEKSERAARCSPIESDRRVARHPARPEAERN